jgi:hypothetical protein
MDHVPFFAHYRTPRPLPAAPLAMPLPPREPLVAPPRVGIPPPLPARGMPPLPLPVPIVLGAGAGVWGVWNLEDTLLLGGFSTKDVSVVRNVASRSSGPWLRFRLAAPRSGWFCGLLKDSTTGAWRCISHFSHGRRPFPPSVAMHAYLWKINTECVHVHAVEKAGKALREARQALMHELQLDKIRLEVGHGVTELGEAILEALERVCRRRCATTALHAVA